MRKFVIFGMGRSGSTLLVSLLNAHPDIFCDGEIFGNGRHLWRTRLLPIIRHFPLPYVYYRQVTIAYRKRGGVYGFNLHLGQVIKPAQLIQQFKALGWHILYLERRSIFAQTISSLVARKTHRYHGYGNSKEPDFPRFPIPSEQFLKILQERKMRTQECRAIVSTLPHLSVVYEYDLELPENWDATVARICNYLDIEAPSHQVHTPLAKPWSRPYSELVTNYAELVELACQLETDA